MKVIRDENQVLVQSPYNPDLPSRAKNLGGKWQPSDKAWAFDIRDEERVAELYRSIYGEWDSNGAIPDAVTAKVTVLADYGEYHQGLFFAGRQLARATGRDSGAKLGPGVIVLKGNFDSGGSAKNWSTRVLKGTVFEIRDAPLCKVKEEMKNTDLYKIEILGDVDKAALMAEKEKLMARIAEIDELLSGKG